MNPTYEFYVNDTEREKVVLHAINYAIVGRITAAQKGSGLTTQEWLSLSFTSGWLITEN